MYRLHCLGVMRACSRISLFLKPRRPSVLVPCPLSPAGALIVTPIHGALLGLLGLGLLGLLA